jgi:nicotinamidase-related amidase
VANYTDPHWARSALIVIDLQRDTLEGAPFEIPGTSDVVPRVVQLVEAFRKADRPIVHIVRLYVPGDSDVDLPRRTMVEDGGQAFAPGTDGSQIAAGVLPEGVELDAELLLSGAPQPVGDREVIFFKPRWSAFHRTRLESWLEAHDCDTVVLAGCNLPNCPRATLFDASERDLRAVLVVDAVSQTTEERLADMARIGVRLMSTVEAVAELSADEPALASVRSVRVEPADT